MANKPKLPGPMKAGSKPMIPTKGKPGASAKGNLMAKMMKRKGK